MKQFFEDVTKGLNASPKYLQSKYFYDKRGDKLFQQIMNCDDYYLTNCELEIFSEQTSCLADIIIQQHSDFDVVELGAGDAMKSIYLLRELVNQQAIGTYFPVDISNNIINLLHKKLPSELPKLNIHGLNGEYLEMLGSAKKISNKIKLVLFLGSNIGNMSLGDAPQFCRELRQHLSPGDMVLVGIDLKKNPKQILAAYNDSNGFTRKFNLNLLRRINDELKGDFDVEAFEHYASYDPQSGACKSFLVSLKDQDVRVGENEKYSFRKDETIFMEISQKYTVEQSDELAVHSGFIPVGHFFDKNKWFADVIWRCV